MILEEETFEAFGYYPSKLKPKSGKRIFAACDRCGKVRTIRKSDYRRLCPSCALKGNTHSLGHVQTEEHKRNISKNHADYKGDKHPAWTGGLVKCKCLQCNKEFEVAPSKIEQGGGKYCSPLCSAKAHISVGNYNYNGGKRAYIARGNAKRKRDLGYTLLMPFEASEVGHHVTDEDIIGIPERVHQRFSGYSRKKHRSLVFEWLKENDVEKYKIILCILNK